MNTRGRISDAGEEAPGATHLQGALCPVTRPNSDRVQGSLHASSDTAVTPREASFTLAAAQVNSSQGLST